MSGAADSPPGEEYGEAEVNERGRLTIPKELRDDLHIEDGTTFTVVREGNDIRLVRELPELHTVSADKTDEDWDDRAFRDAGRATFGGR